jgi:multiple antibiotic resistance protein
MGRELSLFIGTFTTLLAIINPFEVLPVYLKLLEGTDVGTHRRVAWKSCVYALLLSLFFLIFGTLILRLFGVPLSMVRIVGGIIFMKIGFELFCGQTFREIGSNGDRCGYPHRRLLRLGNGCRSDL